ncbi:hypothetical protein ACFXPT_11790 [Streptomyces goshikiensis]|uniref:hypothetical protein n=1 Tax=Streptomyces goshikiensis TaxID=1942 RepID=UPI0036B2F82F
MEQPIRASMNAPVARTYDEIINDHQVSEDDKQRARADSLLGHMAALLFQRGHLPLLEHLRQVRVAEIEYDLQDQTTDLWLEFDPADFVNLSDSVQTDLREIFGRVSRRLGYGVDWLGFRETMPSVGPDWRQQLDEMLSGDRPTNQARRMMPEKPSNIEDRLAFTNAGELRVYRALKHLQEKELPPEDTISIFPLPFGRVPGRTWEPDVVVAYKGRAGVLEIDGPHHRARRAVDTSRDHLLMDSGFAFVDRITVEAVDNPAELMAALKRFLRRLREAG